MNKTEIMLNRLSAGEFQQLAFELLPRLNHKWEGLIHNGAVEGTHKTRKVHQKCGWKLTKGISYMFK